MVLKRKIDNEIRAFFASSGNALLITGSRQVGKTYSIRQFGQSFTQFVEINFIEYPEAVEIFRSAKNSRDILLRLSALTQKAIADGEDTLIFFDEVQVCPDIVTAIKFLVEEGSYRYILSGSLLGVELQDLRSAPVGYLTILEMYPLGLEEFAWAVGVSELVIDELRSCWKNRQMVDPVVHQKMLEIFRLYLIVGGMPAAVSAYLQTNNLQDVLLAQRGIVQLYKRDISKYDPNNKLYIEEIFNLIPAELNSKNRRFILKRLNEKARFERYQNSFLWLSRAGVALAVYNVEEPALPLQLSRLRNLFKLFSSDVGLLASQYASGIQLQILQEHKGINIGSVYENAVAQELFLHGYQPMYFNSKRYGEVDFVVEYEGRVLPIEVKSGKSYSTHRALANIMDVQEWKLREAIVLSEENLHTAKGILYAPIYMMMFLNPSQELPSVYRLDLSELN